MDPKEICRQTLNGSDTFIQMYLQGLSDSDLLVQAVPGMNPIAWQLGHLISVERMIVEALKPNSCPALPEGFDAAHGKGKGQVQPPEGFLPLADYEALWKQQRAATLAALDAVPSAELDDPSPIERLRHRAPTVGQTFNFVGLHTMLHVGQFVAVRRVLDKPVAL